MRTVVTGAASGIGRATVLRLAAAGGHLLLVDRDEESLLAILEEAKAAGAQAHGLVADLVDVDVPRRIANSARDLLGGLDGLVSNAGAIQSSPLSEVSATDFERLFGVNTRATLLLGSAVLPMLQESRGAIVATASLSSEQPSPGLGVYSASKAALVMLVRQMALEWGPLGVRCNCVSPGPTHTALTAASYDDPERREKRAQDIPLRRVGDPYDIADAIIFLLGSGAAFVSGVNLMVDGGMTQTLMVSPNGAAQGVGNR